MSGRLGFLAPWLMGALLAGSVTAQDPGREDPRPENPAPSSRRPVEALRQRLRERPPSERESLERHLEEFEKLTPEARAWLLERARGLRERERSLDPRDGHPPRQPRSPREPGVRRPAPEEKGRGEDPRRELRERLREEGRALRERLPQGLRERLEKAQPEQRRRFLERLQAERERRGTRALELLGRRLGLSPRELHHLQSLPPRERERALRELAKQRRRGPGPGH